MPDINENNCKFCYIDIDIDNHRSKFGLAAAFVHATDTRYGFSSEDLRKLGGSELSRIKDLIESDHEWSEKLGETKGIEVKAPAPHGNRIVIELFWKDSPLACENFATLCANGNNSLHCRDPNSSKKVKPAPIGDCGKPLTYKDSIIHRYIPNKLIQGGDFVFGNGSGGESVYGKKFKDERGGLALKHDERGIVSMGNSGKNSNTSQFFIALAEKIPQCDGKHVVFGRVVSGLDVLDAIERNVDVDPSNEKPIQSVTITDCGIFHPLVNAGAGYWYDQPDVESFTGSTPVFMVRPRVAIVAPSEGVCEKFTTALGTNAIVIENVIVSCEEDDVKCNDEITKLLDTFSVDVVIIAPAYKGKFDALKLPRSWNELRNLDKNEVILQAKPIEALRKIKLESWIGKDKSLTLS